DGVWLRPDRGAQRESGADETPCPSPTLEPADHAERAADEKHAHQVVALARLPRAAGEMIRGERERGPGGGDGAPARREQRERARGRREPREIEEAPGTVTGAERAQERQMEHVHARLVDVVEVAIRHITLADAPRDVVHDGRVLDERPGQREHEQDDRQQTEAGDHDGASDHEAAHQLVLGSRYRCCNRPSTPRGIRSTTAMMMAPKSSGWTYG